MYWQKNNGIHTNLANVSIRKKSLYVTSQRRLSKYFAVFLFFFFFYFNQSWNNRFKINATNRNQKHSLSLTAVWKPQDISLSENSLVRWNWNFLWKIISTLLCKIGTEYSSSIKWLISWLDIYRIHDSNFSLYRVEQYRERTEYKFTLHRNPI